jgi:hypothetical protein
MEWILLFTIQDCSGFRAGKAILDSKDQVELLVEAMKASHNVVRLTYWESGKSDEFYCSNVRFPGEKWEEG